MTLEAIAEDKAKAADGTATGNISQSTTVAVNLFQFNMDIVNPTGSITAPSANARINNLATISGIAADDLSSVGAIAVEISSGTGAKSYWNDSGAGWTGTQHWNSVTAAGRQRWNYTRADAVTGKDYYLRLLVTDVAGQSICHASLPPSPSTRQSPRSRSPRPFSTASIPACKCRRRLPAHRATRERTPSAFPP